MCLKSLFIFLLLLFSTILTAQEKNNWETYFEKSGFRGTSSYEETVQYFKKFEQSYPEVKVISAGKSPQGRELDFVIISKEKKFTPEDSKTRKKPVVMIIAGIHSGEIEGKDALMLLVRDIVISGTKKYLLDNVTLVIAPIFSVDAHERKSDFNRINQNGPEKMGWRTTAQNLNLNRDWLKADAPEMQSMLKVFNEWLPDYFIDCHTSDGADYQYSVTYSVEKYRNIYNGTAIWNKYTFLPYLIKGVEEQGYLVCPYVGFKDNVPDSGLVENEASPRFSNGYAALQNRPALLIETHMMKPYKERVLATKAMLNTALQYIYEHPSELLLLNRDADTNTLKELVQDKKFLPVAYETTDKPKTFLFKGFEAVKETSIVSGALKTVYTGNKFEKYIPYYDTVKVVDSIRAPKAYLIPMEYSLIVEKLKLHNIMVDQIQNDTTLLVKKYKFRNVKFAQNSYEGRQRVNYDYDTYFEKVKVSAGTYMVSVNQRTIRVILNLLDPKSEDSFVKWGFMNAIFEQKEYFEPYVMERVAQQMLKDDPDVKEEFYDRLANDQEFRKNPYQRLNFFYERSPYYDKNLRVYPIMVLE